MCWGCASAMHKGMMLWHSRGREEAPRDQDTCYNLPVQEFHLCAVFNPQYITLLTTVLPFLRLLVYAASGGLSLWLDTVRKSTVMFLTTNTSAGLTM